MSEKEEHPVSQSGHKNDRDVDPQNSEEGQDQPAKKAKVEDVATCVVCFEEGSESSPILSTHQCPQCSKGAWNICLVCNEGLLSRTCPVCRGDYAPMVMHLIPGTVTSAKTIHHIFINFLPIRSSVEETC
jgi:hypothetical protein